MNTIQQQWQSFSTVVIPKNASAIQIQEMRRSFYAGAEAMMRIQWAIGDSAISEDAGVQILEGCREEMKMFAAQLAAGTA